MRMLRPSPGEVADRQTILLLKCRYGSMKHVNIKPFQDEHIELQTYLQLHWFIQFAPVDDPKGIKFDVLTTELQEVNNNLWKLEDEIRLRAKQTPIDKERLLEIALLVPKLNDQRSDLVQKINKLFFVAEQEKIYLAQ